ncbi:MAG TPA: serine/threonine-protein kinase [Longimicrobiales bacterium]|nr:serine/threonine-protein kinase [Longimicrobiales bacterium]
MDAVRWERVQSLFHAALDHPETERRAFLEAACADDPDILLEVLELLDEDARVGSVLDRGLATIAHEVLELPEPAMRMFGPYRILRLLGEGGMGVVYLAEREDLGTRVAVKMLRDAALSPARRERFAVEQRTLAQLNHPSIARLYDAGTLPDGTPYIVMEYVEGEPLNAYCARHSATLPERLRLFMAACEAVQHAHRHAIIHRDIKPSNILVTEGGSVKLLDFGVAKHLERQDASADMTRTGLRPMTPAYAAPEQITGDPIGTYADVYALGVVLYELLTGRLPYDLSDRTPGQAEREILEREPERPSVAARRSGSDRASGSLAPVSADPRAWADLDVLCMTAMHKDPQRRYRTVDALIRDVERFLTNRPLEARPDSWRYRMGKFLRRHQRPVAAAAVVLCAMIGLVVFYTVRLAAARDAAVAEAARARRIQQFTLSLFEGGDPTVGPSDTTRVLTLLERGVQEAHVLENEPAMKAEVLETLGEIFQKLGDFARAESLLVAALDLRRERLGADHPDVVPSLIALGALRQEQARYEEAERLVREALVLGRRHYLSEHPIMIEAMVTLGSVLQARGDFDGATAVLQDAIRLESARGPATPELASALNILAITRHYAGDYEAADSLNLRLLAMSRELYGERHPNVADDLINLGASQFERGRYSEAEELFRQALDIILGFHGPDHHKTASILTILGRALVAQARYDEADDLLRRALAVRERVFGQDHPHVASTLNELAQVAGARGDTELEEAYYRRMSDIYEAAHGTRHYLVGIAKSNLATVFMKRDQYEQAEALLREVVGLFIETLSADHMNTAIARVKLGRVLARRGQWAEAEVESRAGYEIIKAQADPSSNWLRFVRGDLVEAYEALGRPEEAARFRAELVATAP